MDANTSISAWLAHQGFRHYADLFEKNAIHWDILYDITADDLKEMGINAIGDRRRLLKAIALREELAEPLPVSMSSAPGAAEGERKWVTILFADIKDSTALVGKMDPEDAADHLAAAMKAMSEAVHNYGGTVNRTMGDGVMALFGAPKALENHAQLACQAGLAIIARVAEAAPELQVRVGINSGHVLARLVDTDIGQDYDAIGPAVHLAARLEQLAAPGNVCIGADTVAFARGYLQFKEIPPQTVKGYDQPVECYQLVGVKHTSNRFDVRREAGLSPFVGRRAEMTMLQNIIETATEERPYIVTLSGDPGVGKSRLAYELLQAVDTRDWNLIKLSTHPQSLSDLNGLIRNLVYHALGMTAEDTALMQVQCLQNLRAIDPELETFLSPIQALLSLPVEEEAWEKADVPIRRRRQVEAVHRLLSASCRQQPIFIFIEDLHWLDSESLFVIKTLTTARLPMRLFLMSTARREFRPPWRRQENATVVFLEDLDPQAADRLVTALIGRDPSLDSYRSRLITRTGGRPLFLEEAILAAVEHGNLIGDAGDYELAPGADDIEVPRSVQAVISARLDAIPPQAKELLQYSAVIGDSFSQSLLQEISGFSLIDIEKPLIALTDSEYLRIRQVYPETVYTFKHALLRDVAYDEIPRGKRRQLHGKILKLLESRQKEDINITSDYLAHHAYQARDWQKAVHYLVEAGKRALEQSAYKDATGFYERALRALRRADQPLAGNVEVEMYIRAGLHSSILSTGDYARLLVEARHIEMLAERSGRTHDLVKIRAGMTNILVHLGFVEEALAVNSLARTALLKTKNPFWAAAVSTQRAETLYYTGRFTDAHAELIPHLPVMRKELRHIRYGIVTLSIFYLTILNGTQIVLGEIDAAKNTSILIHDILASDEAMVTDKSSGYSLTAVLHHYTGNYKDGYSFANHSLEFCEAYALWYQYAWVGGQFALSSCAAGEFDRGLSVGRRSIEIADRLGLPTHRTVTRSYLAGALLLAGETNEALNLAETALVLARQHRFLLLELMTLPYQLAALMMQPHPDDQHIQNLLQSAFRSCNGVQARLGAAQIHILAAAFTGARSRTDTAAAHLRKAASLFEEMNIPAGATKITAMRKELETENTITISADLILLR